MSTDLKERIEELLAGLGDTVEEIAAALHGQNVTGVRDDCWHCPIANLIAARIPGADSWTTEDFAVNDEYVKTPVGKVMVSDAVGEFVHRFDLGWFPHLDSETDAGAER